MIVARPKKTFEIIMALKLPVPILLRGAIGEWAAELRPTRSRRLGIPCAFVTTEDRRLGGIFPIRQETHSARLLAVHQAGQRRQQKDHSSQH